MDYPGRTRNEPGLGAKLAPIIFVLPVSAETTKLEGVVGGRPIHRLASASAVPKPKRLSTPAGVLTPLALALGVFGCGSRTIDATRAREFVRNVVKPTPRSVHCPSGVRARRGKTLDCTLVARSGGSLSVTLHIVDEGGRVRIGPSDIGQR